MRGFACLFPQDPKAEGADDEGDCRLYLETQTRVLKEMDKYNEKVKLYDVDESSRMSATHCLSCMARFESGRVFA